MTHHLHFSLRTKFFYLVCNMSTGLGSITFHEQSKSALCAKNFYSFPPVILFLLWQKAGTFFLPHSTVNFPVTVTHTHCSSQVWAWPPCPFCSHPSHTFTPAPTFLLSFARDPPTLSLAVLLGETGPDLMMALDGSKHDPWLSGHLRATAGRSLATVTKRTGTEPCGFRRTKTWAGLSIQTGRKRGP